jgi:hypothetical protein
MLPNRGLTEEELAKIPVSEEEEREMEALVDAVENALDKGRIPPTLDWALTCISWSTQWLCVMGMPSGYFAGVVDAVVEAAGVDPSTCGIYTPQIDTHGGTQMAARINRLRGALLKKKIDPGTSDTCMALIIAAVAMLHCQGMGREGIRAACTQAFAQAEERIVAMSKKSEHQA